MIVAAVVLEVNGWHLIQRWETQETLSRLKACFPTIQAFIATCLHHFSFVKHP
jgi:hypothetical protein